MTLVEAITQSRDETIQDCIAALRGNLQPHLCTDAQTQLAADVEALQLLRTQPPKRNSR